MKMIKNQGLTASKILKSWENKWEEVKVVKLKVAKKKFDWSQYDKKRPQLLDKPKIVEHEIVMSEIEEDSKIQESDKYLKKNTKKETIQQIKDNKKEEIKFIVSKSNDKIDKIETIENNNLLILNQSEFATEKNKIIPSKANNKSDMETRLDQLNPVYSTLSKSLTSVKSISSSEAELIGLKANNISANKSQVKDIKKKPLSKPNIDGKEKPLTLDANVKVQSYSKNSDENLSIRSVSSSLKNSIENDFIIKSPVDE